jgi:hypothetical protein
MADEHRYVLLVVSLHFSSYEEKWRQVAYWLKCWASNRKVAESNPLANKGKICRFTPEQGSSLFPDRLSLVLN